MVRVRENSPRYLFVELFICHASKRELAAQHREEKYSTGPDISWGPNIFSFAADFWAHVRWGAAEYFKFDVIRRGAAEAEVDQL